MAKASKGAKASTKKKSADVDETPDDAPMNSEVDTNEETDEEEAPKKKAKADVYMVAKEFRDKDNFGKSWRKGHDVSHFDQERLDHLVNTGMVIKK